MKNTIRYSHNQKFLRGPGAVLSRRAPGRRRQNKIEEKLDQVLERLELIPPQVRQLGVKVDDMTQSIGDPRIRDLLGRFLMLYDLIDQMERGAGENEDVENYRVLRRQVLQVLELNGISRIAELERFDPGIHKVVETVFCSEPAEEGEIKSLFRDGFRTERAVLRYAEVVVKRYRVESES